MTNPLLVGAAGSLLAYLCDFGAFGRMRNIMSQRYGRGDEWCAGRPYNLLAPHRLIGAIAFGILAYYGTQGDTMFNRAAFVVALICGYLMTLFSYSRLNAPSS